MMKPKIGRVVLFTPSSDDEIGPGPLSALICHVWSDAMVNLAVFDRNGNPHSRTSVTLLQPDDPPQGWGYYCRWPVIG